MDWQQWVVGNNVNVKCEFECKINEDGQFIRRVWGVLSQCVFVRPYDSNNEDIQYVCISLKEYLS